MQGGRSILDSLTETIDLNQGLVPSSNSMDRSSPWDNILDPVGSRFSNSVLVASEGNAGCTSAPSFSGWDQGESSSSSSNYVVNGRIYCNNLKPGHMWPSSSSNYVIADQGSEERGFESSNVFVNKSFSSSYGGNHLISRPSTHHYFNSNHSPGNVNSNYGTWQLKKICFPIFHREHYFLLCFDFPNYRYEIIDNMSAPTAKKLKYGESIEDLKNMMFEFYRTISPRRSILCAGVDGKRMQMEWRDSKNKIDCGVFLMCHMETYLSQGVKKWDCGLIKGDTSELHKLRMRFMKELSISEYNIH
nr:E3 ubiquitin-protein ligase MBR2-like [Ipomoea batatas]